MPTVASGVYHSLMSNRPRRWRAATIVFARIPYISTLRARQLRARVPARRKTVIVYVDGFNLYRNRMQKHPDLKWLDFVRLCELLMPGFKIKLVRFFTAEIHALRGTDPRAPSRQMAYLRALSSNPRIVIHRGKFLQSPRNMAVLPIEENPDGSLMKVKVRKIEEKQSDVNLGAYMVADAMRNEADVYVLLSSDSDFAGLMKMMIGELGKTMGLISPIDSFTGELRAAGPKYFRRIRVGSLVDSQLPDLVGRNRRPDAWQKSRGPDDIEAPRPVAEASGVVSPI